MSASLPDIAVSEPSPWLSPLDWVGMQGIDIPLWLGEPGDAGPVHARADVQVDLPDPRVKGIHMSRLHGLLDGLGSGDPLSAAALAQTLSQMVQSHADCGTTQARLQLSFDFLRRRPALVTAGLSGWKSYPVRVDAHWTGGVLRLQVQATVAYSSTCPCSAALSRQVIEQQFLAAWAGRGALDATDVAAWLRQHASAATPHSQRSLAHVRVAVPDSASPLGLSALIERVEGAVATPVQTAVKRADEQAFAVLNGQNLMYVEDAARRIRQGLVSHYSACEIAVRHLESLHAHDAVAHASFGAA